MLEYLREIWHYRYFWSTLVKIDLASRYRRSALGMAWSLLHPLAMTAVACTVFTQLFGMDLYQYAPRVLAGLAFWGFITTCVLHGCQSLHNAEPFLRQHPAPAAIYPLRTALSAGFHFCVALTLVLVLGLILNGPQVMLAWPLIIPMLAALFLFGWAIATLAAFFQVYFPDAMHLLEVGLQIVFYLTPILYPTELLRAKGLGWLADANPLAYLLESIRLPAVTGTLPGWHLAFGSVMLALVAATCASAVLQRWGRRVVLDM